MKISDIIEKAANSNISFFLGFLFLLASTGIMFFINTLTGSFYTTLFSSYVWVIITTLIYFIISASITQGIAKLFGGSGYYIGFLRVISLTLILDTFKLPIKYGHWLGEIMQLIVLIPILVIVHKFSKLEALAVAGLSFVIFKILGIFSFFIITALGGGI
ncbi:hypothetical protein J4479_04950 [Candidatus Woesearchaeota archaeon]|nr:hypothetical protein [Candidatus Woesearchaeota archaeon]